MLTLILMISLRSLEGSEAEVRYSMMSGYWQDWGLSSRLNEKVEYMRGERRRMRMDSMCGIIDKDYGDYKIGLIAT